jgi:hypothetical protein
MLLSRIFLTVLCATSLTACLEESKTSDPIVIGDIACGPQHATTFSANIQSSDYSAFIKQSDYGTNNDFLLVKDDKIKARGLFYNVQSDFITSAYGRSLYLIGRDDVSTIQKFDASSIITGTGLFQTENNLGYALRDAGVAEGANPYAIGFINQSYAIVPRYATNTAWLVNLEAQQESDFKICELDLSAYVTTEVINSGTASEETVIYSPNMSNVTINANYAAITMQRLNGFTAVESSYVAIFDLSTWEELDTNPSEEGLKGLELSLKNPQGIASFEDSIYLSSIVYSTPNYGCASGGIEKVDLNTLTTEIIDDTTCYDGVATTESGQLYAIENHANSYSDTDAQTLYEFDLATNTKSVVAGFEDTILNSINAYSQDLWYSQNSVVGRINTFNNTKEGVEVTLEQPSRGISFINF